MRSPRIITTHSPALLERLAFNWLARYGTAIAAVALFGAVAHLVGSRIDQAYHVLTYFAAILLASVLSGLGPGLLASGLAMALMYWAPPADLTGQALGMLIIAGILVSLVGGALRAERRKAMDWLAANLRLEQQVLEVSDDERRRIGHDLHDGLGQHLTGISLLSETINQQLAAGNRPNPADVETITRLVSEAVGITRDLAKTLSPVTLERDGFVAAAQELADTSSALLGVNCTWEVDQEPPLEWVQSLHLYRIIQEAVNNSVRHGKAKHIHIAARCQGRELSVTVTDDGSGLSEKTMHNPGLGLRIMQYRCKMLGASLTVERASALRGTIVTCTCPLNDEKTRSPAQR